MTATASLSRWWRAESRTRRRIFLTVGLVFLLYACLFIDIRDYATYAQFYLFQLMGPSMLPDTITGGPLFVYQQNNTLAAIWTTNTPVPSMQLHVQVDTGTLQVPATLASENDGYGVYVAKVQRPTEGNLHYKVTDTNVQRIWAEGVLHLPSSAEAANRNDLSQQIHRVALISDNQNGLISFLGLLRRLRHNTQNSNRDTINSNLATLVHVGDSVQRANSLALWHTMMMWPLQWRAGLMGRHAVPLAWASGNHDSKLLMLDTPPLDPWYSFSIGPSHWLILNSNIDSAAQDQWLRAELSGPCTHARFVVVVVHIAPFIEYWEPGPWRAGEKHWGGFIKDRYVPLFEQYNVDLVVSGHEHMYQRGDPLAPGPVYAIIGGSGGTLDTHRVADHHKYIVTLHQHHYVILDITPVGLRWAARDIRGRTIDEFTIYGKNRP